MALKLYKEFFFEAAHFLPSAPSGHPNSRIHGHSFRLRVMLQGDPDPQTGLLMNLGDIAAAMQPILEQLDHRLLNEVEGLQVATLENLVRWIWERAKPALPALAEIAVSRDTCMEGCIYSGE
jgi:6-pyruvoyltetrahydropterin/6-carboxytetrahydropterin synthase